MVRMVNTMTLRERFVKLVMAWEVERDDDIMRLITDNMNAFCKYVEAVYTMEYSMPMLRAQYDGQEYRDRVQQLDANRRHAHERAIIAATQLNRWAKMKGVEPLMLGDTTDRYQVADFCEEIVTEFFRTRSSNKTLNEILGR